MLYVALVGGCEVHLSIATTPHTGLGAWVLREPCRHLTGSDRPDPVEGEGLNNLQCAIRYAIRLAPLCEWRLADPSLFKFLPSPVCHLSGILSEIKNIQSICCSHFGGETRNEDRYGTRLVFDVLQTAGGCIRHLSKGYPPYCCPSYLKSH